MSWQEKDLMKLRKEFVFQAMKEDANITLLCHRYMISRKTGYKWIKRYTKEGESSLINKSRRPHSSPNKTKKLMENKILEVRRKHACWGARKIEAVLKRQAIKAVPATSTIHRVLQREECIKEKLSGSAVYKRFEHEAPNRLWQMDFKGHFPYEKARCYPLTILDDHSRFSIALKACRNERGETVKPILIETFKRYGLPERINVDNGNPWGSVIDHARYTTLSVWLIRVGVKVSYSRPYHPQTNGKDERFHRTLKAEIIAGRYYRNLVQIQRYFDEWREIYNLERPHESLDMKVPGDRYKPSYRPYVEELPEVRYADDYLIRKVDSRGRVRFEGRQIFVGVPFAQEEVGIRLTKQAGEHEIYYCQQSLGKFNLNVLKKNTITNLYSGKVVEL